MTRKLIITLAFLLLANTAGALRVIEQIERAVELSLGALTLPSSAGTTISFSECPPCGSSTHRLVNSTVYRANGQTVPRAEFLRIASEISAKPDGANTAVAVVFLDPATGRITRIEVRE
jgi:hypothetical protein